MSATISAEIVKRLRDQTNAGMMDCKKALEESQGDFDGAVDILRKKGAITAQKKSSREAKDGVIASYIHLGGKVGVLVEINCETDFVAKNDTFKEFVKDITLQIAAANPLVVTRDQVPTAIVEKEREITLAQLANDPKNAKKPKDILEKIVQGKLDKYYTTACLMEQAFVKNPEVTIQDLLTKKIQELGENIVIRRFVRFQVGEALT
ncbi:MAG: translation elongation factor Ts [Verrucomicrobiae bacterium]|nr:translation elongation factor Ts [Verrucomicrobiae bacterium]